MYHLNFWSLKYKVVLVHILQHYMFSDDFSGNRSYLIRLNSLYIKGGIQKRWVARMNVNKQTANTRKFIKKLIKKYN